MIAMTIEGTLLDEWELPGGNQEGVTIADCSMYVAEEIPRHLWQYPLLLKRLADSRVELNRDSQLAHYDVITAPIEDFGSGTGVGGANCLVDDLAEPTTDDRLISVTDALGAYYVVRGKNICGIGTYGSGTDGVAHVPLEACP